jgi:cell shape-determining protein MreD
LIRKGIQFIVLVFLTYLLQAAVAYHVAIAGVAPNIAIAVIAVVSIALGHKYTFVISLAVGYMLEIMMPSLEYIYLILYPVCAMLGSLFFADKSERRMEEERSTGKKVLRLPAHIRTMLCALLSIVVFEAVNLLYVYLSGIRPDAGHYSRALISAAYTTLLAGLLQFPIRRWLGIHKLKKAPRLS